MGTVVCARSGRQRRVPIAKGSRECRRTASMATVCARARQKVISGSSPRLARRIYVHHVRAAADLLDPCKRTGSSSLNTCPVFQALM